MTRASPTANVEEFRELTGVIPAALSDRHRRMLKYGSQLATAPLIVAHGCSRYQAHAESTLRQRKADTPRSDGLTRAQRGGGVKSTMLDIVRADNDSRAAAAVLPPAVTSCVVEERVGATRGRFRVRTDQAPRYRFRSAASTIALPIVGTVVPGMQACAPRRAEPAASLQSQFQNVKTPSMRG